MWVKFRLWRKSKRRQLCKSVRPTLEALELRLAPANLSLLAGQFDSFFSATPPASAYTPAQIRQAYGFDHIAFQSNGSQVAGDGTGQTIAIVEAYNDANIRRDLDAFDSQFSIGGGNQSLLEQYGPSSSFLTVVGQNGGSTLPARSNAGWALETALDVEWAHAIAPGANILLVEANSSNLGNLLAAVNTARNAPGVVAVSLSWGISEFYLNPNAQAYYDQNLFVTPSNHTGVTFVAASGDDGGINGPIWPSASPNVLSVGGTTLPADVAGNPSISNETGWSGSGGGYSFNENAPSYQLDYFNATGNPVLDPNVSSNSRATPDVAFNADPSTGYPVYNSVTYSGQSGWFQVGGTSAGAPQWSGLIAIADQGRQLAGKGTATNWSLDGVNQTLPTLYSLASDPASYANNFNDITTGSNSYNSAGPGFDLVTGLGTPVANHLVGGLVQDTSVAQATAPKKPKIAAASSATDTAGTKALTTDLTGQATSNISPVALSLLINNVSLSVQHVSAPASLLVRGPALTVSSPLIVQIAAPRLLSPPQYLGGESAPLTLSNIQPDDDLWVYNVPSNRDMRPDTPGPSNLADTTRQVKAESTAWRLASDACFSDATKPGGLEDDSPAALLIPTEDSTLTLNSAAGLAAMAFVLAGTYRTPAEPQNRKRQRFLQ
jgi:subtilase family serine protease